METSTIVLADERFTSIAFGIGIVLTIIAVVTIITAIVYGFVVEQRHKRYRHSTELKKENLRKQQLTQPLLTSTTTTTSTDKDKEKTDAKLQYDSVFTALPVSSLSTEIKTTPLMPFKMKNQQPVPNSPSSIHTPPIEPPIRREKSVIMEQTQETQSERGYIEEFIANQSCRSTLRRPAEPEGPIDDSRLLDAFQF